MGPFYYHVGPAWHTAMETPGRRRFIRYPRLQWGSRNTQGNIDSSVFLCHPNYNAGFQFLVTIFKIVS